VTDRYIPSEKELAEWPIELLHEKLQEINAARKALPESYRRDPMRLSVVIMLDVAHGEFVRELNRRGLSEYSNK
jgi:hypothetical protein